MKLHVRLVHVCAALLLCGALLLSAAGAGAEARKVNWFEAMRMARAACQARSADPAGAWKTIERDYPLEAIRMQKDSGEKHLAWFTSANPAALEKKLIEAALKDLGAAGAGLEREWQTLEKSKSADSAARLKLYARAGDARKLNNDLNEKVNFPALRRAVADLEKSFSGKYAAGPEALRRAQALETRLPAARAALATGSPEGFAQAAQYLDDTKTLQREALLANPLLDFDKLLLIKRTPVGNPYRSEDPDKGTGRYIGMPQQSSWQLHTIPTSFTQVWDNEIDTLDLKKPEGALETLYKSPNKRLLSDMDLHFDGDRVLFSMPDAKKLWQLWELNTADRKLRQVSHGDQPDVHSLDGCYMPNNKIAFISTAVFQGVPCNAGVNVGMLYSMNEGGGGVRQLCFDQDHNFCPTMLPDGRVMYMRWEYADIPHVWARFLFTMNPDGSRQREYFGTGSYWPNGIWYARPVPGSSKVIGVCTGHHVGRQGELYLFDPAVSHDKTKGTVQQIPGWGKKPEPVIQDKLTEKLWPKFLHPWPLNDKYFIVACRPSPEDSWGIYLADVFDNLTPIKVIEREALLEPIPLRAQPKPPVIEERVDLARKDSLIFIEDIYKGTGLPGVPRGTIKSLRLVTYHFAYRTVAGIDHRVGADGPWEPKVILGTVPVEKDGSAFFRVPANTPLTVHALDEQGRAVQIMRSWMTPMPGEILNCVGCHEQPNGAPPSPSARGIAGRKPAEITPWHGPARGLSFIRDVQPVLDEYCAGCHNGVGKDNGIPDLRRDPGYYIGYKKSDPEAHIVQGPVTDKLLKTYPGLFYPSYIALRARVRPAGIESDLRPLSPMEFDVRTTELIQMLEKGHHGVKLSAEAWDRLYTWIDLNAPAHGTWQEVVGGKKIENDHRRRVEVKELYGGLYDDPERIVEAGDKEVKPVAPAPAPAAAFKPVSAPGWPLDAAAAARAQGPGARRTVDLGGGVKLDLVRVPAGRFVMGDPRGGTDEQPAAAIEIKKPFWMGACEITNEQYNCFDPQHDSRFEHKGTWKFELVDLGWPLNDPKQPVVRISWQEAMAFCSWLGAKTGQKASLPTEAQWEYACRAGADTPFSFGDLNTDFAPFANLGDASLRALAYDLRGPRPPDLQPRDDRFSDGQIVTCAVGSYKPNAWGLCDMHGNAWEWTRSLYKPYPYRAEDGREAAEGDGLRAVRGGSWFDRPKRCTSSFRLSYEPWQKVYNVGFRVIVEDDGATRVAEK